MIYTATNRFEPKEVTAENAATVNHLLVVLMNAERAWAYAMELQSEAEERE